MSRALLAALCVISFLAAPACASDPPSQAPPSSAPAKQAAHPRQTWEQHFTQANTAHDGHLTLEQAKAGYPSLAKHFVEIDTGGKGYVTTEDVRAWHKQRAVHPAAQDNKLRPRQAYQRGSSPMKAVVPVGG